MPQCPRECTLRAAWRVLLGSRHAPDRWRHTSPLPVPLPIERDAPIVHFRSHAVSGMMPLWNAEGHERESNDGNTFYQRVGLPAKALPFPRLTLSPAMWKGSWRNCGRSNPSSTIVLRGVNHAPISL